MSKGSSKKVRVAMADYLAEQLDPISGYNREKIFQNLKKSPIILLARMIVGLATPADEDGPPDKKAALKLDPKPKDERKKKISKKKSRKKSR